VPEGDALRRLANRINQRFAGQRVQRSITRDPRIATVDFRSRVLVDADAYGKHLFVRFDDARTLHAHLLLTGSFDVGRASRDPAWKRRVELWMEDGRLTGVAVPLLDVIPTSDEHTIIDHLGPDLCALAGPPDIDEVTARLVRDREAPLAGALLDQRNVAGFGNVYANDLPFIAGIDPHHPVGAVDGLVDLVAIGTALIRLNVANGAINTTGRRLGTGDHWIHGLGRGRCPVCGSSLHYRDADTTPWQRSITWCPTCQPSLQVDTRVDLARARKLVALHPGVREPDFPRSQPSTGDPG
jgi:formamidopyrimidine-DNA glycosylase